MAWISLLARTAFLLSLLAVVVVVAALRHAASPASAGPNCDSTGSIDSEELEFLRLVNDYRAQSSLRPYVLSHSLNRSASWKAQDMADNGYFSHDDTPIGRGWGQRIRDCGYMYEAYVGENLAGGYPAAADTLGVWQHSPGHNGLLLSDTFRAIGLGRAHNDEGYWFWAMDVGAEIDAQIASGDVDCNDSVDTVDASLILQRAAGLVTDLQCETEADTDSSGAIGATDALLVLQYDAGLVS